jgi:hypothetical protein
LGSRSTTPGDIVCAKPCESRIIIGDSAGADAWLDELTTGRCIRREDRESRIIGDSGGVGAGLFEEQRRRALYMARRPPVRVISLETPRASAPGFSRSKDAGRCIRRAARESHIIGDSAGVGVGLEELVAERCGREGRESHIVGDSTDVGVGLEELAAGGPSRLPLRWR